MNGPDAFRYRPDALRCRHNAFKTGDILVEPSSGRVLRTTLNLVQDVERTRAQVVVSFQMSGKLGVLVPVEMREWYGFEGMKPEEGISCTATYSDFRRFEAAGRLILR